LNEKTELAVTRIWIARSPKELELACLELACKDLLDIYETPKTVTPQADIREIAAMRAVTDRFERGNGQWADPPWLYLVSVSPLASIWWFSFCHS
jgi:hypothetical protein